MTLVGLAWRSLWHRRFATVMTMISVALSVTLLLGVERVRESGRASFGGAISKTDLIVGPRTGSLALLLYSVFRIGSPSQNISLSTMEKLAGHPAVAWTVPFSLGDGYRGFPVVATSKEFFERYKYGKAKDLRIIIGDAGTDPQAAVLGATVAEELSHRLGDQLVVSHGHSEDGDGFEKHAEQPLVVSGILEFTGTPVDRGVWISLEAMHAMHSDEKPSDPDKDKVALVHSGDTGSPSTAHTQNPAAGHTDAHSHDDEESLVSSDDEHEHEHDHDHEHDAEKISGFFLGTKDRSSALSLMRELNELKEEPLTAIMPAVVLNELWRTLAVGEQALSLISMLVAVIGICGMWVSLHILANGRKREIAVLRAAGASPSNVIAFMTGEAVLLCCGGIVLGFVFLYVGLAALGPFVARKYGVSLDLLAPGSREWLFVAVVILASAVAGLVPALRAYKSALQDGLSVRF